MRIGLLLEAEWTLQVVRSVRLPLTPQPDGRVVRPAVPAQVPWNALKHIGAWRTATRFKRAIAGSNPTRFVPARLV